MVSVALQELAQSAQFTLESLVLSEEMKLSDCDYPRLDAMYLSHESGLRRAQEVSDFSSSEAPRSLATACAVPGPIHSGPSVYRFPLGCFSRVIEARMSQHLL